MLWLLLSISLLGFALLALGLRGRAVGREPRCRKCRFDLTGLDVESADSVCPECGGDLSEPKSIRTGHRRRRKLPIALGVFLLLPITGGVAASSNWTDWNASKPLSVLKLDVRFGSARVEAAATKEIFARIDLNKLTWPQQLSLSSIAADRLGKGPFGSLEWFDLAVEGRASGRVSDRAWDSLTARMLAMAQTAADTVTGPTEQSRPRSTGWRGTESVRLNGKTIRYPHPTLSWNPKASLGSPSQMLYVLDRIELDGEPMALINMSEHFNHAELTNMNSIRYASGGLPNGPQWMTDGPPDRHPVTFRLNDTDLQFVSEGLRLEDLPPGEYTCSATWTAYLAVGVLGRSHAGVQPAWNTQAHPVFGPIEITRPLTYKIEKAREANPEDD